MRVKIPLILGNGIEVLGLVIAFLITAAANDVSIVPLKFLLYLLSLGCLIFFPHCLAFHCRQSCRRAIHALCDWQIFHNEAATARY